MAVLTFKKIYVLYLTVTLLDPLLTTGVYFTLTKEEGKGNSIGDNTPRIRKEFFKCGREESCTHIMKVANEYTLIHGSNELRRKKHEATCIYEKVKLSDQNLCESSPCLNGGTCKGGILQYSCVCAAGYAGSNCEQNINECASSPCQNGGKCSDGVNQYTCNCVSPFIGPNCQHETSSQFWSPCTCTAIHIVDLSPQTNREMCYVAAQGRQGTAASFKEGQCLSCYAAVVYSASGCQCRLI